MLLNINTFCFCLAIMYVDYFQGVGWLKPFFRSGTRVRQVRYLGHNIYRGFHSQNHVSTNFNLVTADQAKAIFYNVVKTCHIANNPVPPLTTTLNLAQLCQSVWIVSQTLPSTGWPVLSFLPFFFLLSSILPLSVVFKISIHTQFYNGHSCRYWEYNGEKDNVSVPMEIGLWERGIKHVKTLILIISIKNRILLLYLFNIFSR